MDGTVSAHTITVMDDLPLTTPRQVGDALEAYLRERQAELAPSGERTKDGRRFTWCGDVFEYLTDGLAERMAAHGITFSTGFPGPFRLMDEDQQANGLHVRRFWTVAFARGCPIARLCTYFFHRHDQVPLPQSPLVASFPPDHTEHEVVTE